METFKVSAVSNVWNVQFRVKSFVRPFWDSFFQFPFSIVWALPFTEERSGPGLLRATLRFGVPPILVRTRGRGHTGLRPPFASLTQKLSNRGFSATLHRLLPPKVAHLGKVMNLAKVGTAQPLALLHNRNHRILHRQTRYYGLSLGRNEDVNLASYTILPRKIDSGLNGE